MAFNIAQGFKDIANKLINGLPIENGGTDTTLYPDITFDHLRGFNQSTIILYRNYGSNTSISTSYNYFHASYGNDHIWNTGGENSSWQLSSVVQSITWQDRTQTNTCIKVANNAPTGYILIFGSIRYLKNTTTSGTVQTAIVRLRDNVTSNLAWVTGTYGNERISHSFSQLVQVKPGDVFFLGGWKGAASHDVQIVDGPSYSRWGATWIGL